MPKSSHTRSHWSPACSVATSAIAYLYALLSFVATGQVISVPLPPDRMPRLHGHRRSQGDRQRHHRLHAGTPTARGWHRRHMITGSGRSPARIDRSDLPRLAMIAAEARSRPVRAPPHGAGSYAGRLICRALCQGAAQHYLDGRSGVKDFDVWSFYAARGDGPFPYRWRGTADYGPVEVRALPLGPAVVRRPPGRPARPIARRAARHQPGRCAARLSRRGAHRHGPRTGRQGCRAHLPRAPRRRDNLARRWNPPLTRGEPLAHVPGADAGLLPERVSQVSRAVRLIASSGGHAEPGTTRTLQGANGPGWSGGPAVPRPVPGRRAGRLAAQHHLVAAARMGHRAGAIARRPAHDHAAWPPGMPRLARACDRPRGSRRSRRDTCPSLPWGWLIRGWPRSGSRRRRGS